MKKETIDSKILIPWRFFVGLARSRGALKGGYTRSVTRAKERRERVMERFPSGRSWIVIAWKSSPPSRPGQKGQKALADSRCAIICNI